MGFSMDFDHPFGRYEFKKIEVDSASLGLY